MTRVLMVLIAVMFSAACSGSEDTPQPASQAPLADAGASASAANAGAAAADRPLTIGDTVNVSWQSAWYPAVIIDQRPGEYEIHYIGYGENWDEWVQPRRIRARDAASGDASVVAAPGILSHEPAGHYECTTFDAGQLNRVGEIVLRSNGRYEDALRGGSGRYTYDAGTRAIRFVSGPQKTDAAVVFDPAAHTGKGWLEFTYEGGAKLHCYRRAVA